MLIRVLLFAGLREQIGSDRLALELPESGTIADAVRLLSDRHPELSGQRFMTARNESYASDDVVLNEGDELALIPPVSGG